MFTRNLYAARVSLSVVLVGVLLGFLLGVILDGISATSGHRRHGDPASHRVPYRPADHPGADGACRRSRTESASQFLSGNRGFCGNGPAGGLWSVYTHTGSARIGRWQRDFGARRPCVTAMEPNGPPTETYQSVKRKHPR